MAKNMRLTPDMNTNFDTNMLTVVTVFCYVLLVITAQAVAAVFTIMAAASTLVWNVYKIIMDRRDRRKADQQGHGKVVDINEAKQQSNE